MNKAVLRGFAISWVFISPITYAQNAFDNARVVTGLSLGYSDFSFPEKLDHDISFPSVSIPIGITVDNRQLSVDTNATLRDADISEEEDVGKASRKDVDITLGYRLNKSWSVFSGYKYGKTKMQFTPRDSEDEDDAILTTAESYAQEGPF